MSSLQFKEANVIFILARAFELHLLVRCYHGLALIFLLVTRAAHITAVVVAVVASVVEPSSLWANLRDGTKEENGEVNAPRRVQIAAYRTARFAHR